MGFSLPGIVMKARFYKDGPSRYVVSLWWKGKNHRRRYYDDSVGLVHEELARQVCAGVNADIAQKGNGFDPRQWFRSSAKELQFETYVSKWLLSQTHYAPSVRKDVRRYVMLFLSFFGKTDIREIRKGRIDDFLKTLSGYSPKTQRNIISLLHKIFNDAYKREDLLRIPGFPSVNVPTLAIRWIGEEWQMKILEAIPEEDRLIFVTIATLGLRPGEARALDWGDIDWDQKTIVVNKTFSGREIRARTKNNREKVVPLPADIEEL
jgi:integrase